MAVLALGVAGSALAEAVNLAAPALRYRRPSDVEELSEVLRAGDQCVVDLTGHWPEGSLTALLAELGPKPEHGWESYGHGITVLVPAEELTRALTGLEGLAAVAGRARGADLADVLAADAQAQCLLAELGVADAPGAGAAGGIGALLLATRVRLNGPLQALAHWYALPQTLRSADLLVTGAEALDFHAVGGPLVKYLVSAAEEALIPAVAIVGRNYISARELRLAGLESAYPVLSGPGQEPCPPEGLSEVAAAVARTWRW